MMNIEAKRDRTYDVNPDLIMRYRAGEREAGDELVRLNTPLVYSIAARFRERCPDTSDLIECGHIGLVKAINTFDPMRGCAFSTYAVPLIFGEMRRFLRDDGIIKVSRDERRLGAILNKERERRMALGEAADLVTLAEAVGVSISDAASAITAESPVRSLDEAVYEDDEGVTLGGVIADEDDTRRTYDAFLVRYAISTLTEMERQIIALRYYRDFSQTECARILGISQVKVSREEKRIMEKLRRHLN